MTPGPFGGSTESLATFTEPKLAFRLAARSSTTANICAHLSLESRPPWADGGSGLSAYVVEVQVSLAGLALARDTWTNELDPHPER